MSKMRKKRRKIHANGFHIQYMKILRHTYESQFQCTKRAHETNEDRKYQEQWRQQKKIKTYRKLGNWVIAIKCMYI